MQFTLFSQSLSLLWSIRIRERTDPDQDTPPPPPPLCGDVIAAGASSFFSLREFFLYLFFISPCNGARPPAKRLIQTYTKARGRTRPFHDIFRTPLPPFDPTAPQADAKIRLAAFLQPLGHSHYSLLPDFLSHPGQSISGTCMVKPPGFFPYDCGNVSFFVRVNVIPPPVPTKSY